MSLMRLRLELKAVRTAVNKLRNAIEEHCEAVRAAKEGKRNEHEAAQPIQAVISFDDKTIRDAKTESNQQYGVQNSIRYAAWCAFGAAVIYAGISVLIWCEMRKETIAAQQSANFAQQSARTATAQLDATARPWLEVTPEIYQRITYTVFFGRNHAFVPIKCDIVNYGASPARNVLCNIRIDSVPYVMNELIRADSDLRLKNLCNDTAAQSAKTPDFGIPIFQNKNPITLHQGAENIDERYFTVESTIYMIQGCVDYTYALDKHGQTAFRYLLGKFGPDKTLHGIPFIEGTVEPNLPGNTRRAFLDVRNVDFVRTDGGNYAK